MLIAPCTSAANFSVHFTVRSWLHLPHSPPLFFETPLVVPSCKTSADLIKCFGLTTIPYHQVVSPIGNFAARFSPAPSSVRSRAFVAYWWLLSDCTGLRRRFFFIPLMSIDLGRENHCSRLILAHDRQQVVVVSGSIGPTLSLLGALRLSWLPGDRADELTSLSSLDCPTDFSGVMVPWPKCPGC